MMMKYAYVHDDIVDHTSYMFESTDRHRYSTTGVVQHLDLVGGCKIGSSIKVWLMPRRLKQKE